MKFDSPKGYRPLQQREDCQRRTTEPLDPCEESKADASAKMRAAKSTGEQIKTASKDLTIVIHSKKVLISYSEKRVRGYAKFPSSEE